MHLCIVMLQYERKIPDVKISPNAVKGSYRVHYPRTDFTGPLKADLVSMDGSIVNVLVTVELTTEGDVDVLISNPNSGIYYLRVLDGRTSIIKKIIVQ